MKKTAMAWTAFIVHTRFGDRAERLRRNVEG
jgi:hypothetical protein